MKAIKIHEAGAPDVMKYEDINLEAPEKGQVRIRHTAIGLNYIDTYHRSGAYPLPLPSGIGLEAAGVVEARGCGGRGPRHAVRARFARRAVTWTGWTEWTGWTRKAKHCMRGGRLAW